MKHIPDQTFLAETTKGTSKTQKQTFEQSFDEPIKIDKKEQTFGLLRGEEKSRNHNGNKSNRYTHKNLGIY